MDTTRGMFFVPLKKGEGRREGEKKGCNRGDGSNVKDVRDPPPFFLHLLRGNRGEMSGSHLKMYRGAKI